SLADALNMRNVATISDDYFHRLAVLVYTDKAPLEYSSSPQDFLEDIRFFFEMTRLKRFNQAEILALYECMVLKAASVGKTLSSAHFQQQLDEVLNSYAGQVYRVAGRYGQEGYLSFRRRSYGKT
ncbi:MAG: hypothetical protein MUO17_04465, partial [Dehalococcoidales bacterium]|nr:hypothetical protein [Dehalococcoidales bacterium]